MQTTKVLIAAFALAAAACEPGPTSDVDQRSPDGELPTRTRDVPVSKAIDVTRVVWPERSSIDAATLGRLPEAARAKVGESLVPVMLPRGAGLVEVAKLVVKPAFTAVSMTGEGEHVGLTVSVSATRVSHRYADIPKVEGPSRVRGGKPAFVTQNEAIWSVTWFEHGVSYVVEVECARPSEDARCADDKFVTSLVEDLTFVGGAFDPAEGGAK
jgi:hypothetical protein